MQSGRRISDGQRNPSMVMAVIQVAMQAKLPYTALRDTIFAHPTMAEGLNDLFERLE